MKTSAHLHPCSAHGSGLCFRNRSASLLTVLVLGVMAAGPVWAETLLWTNITGGNWNVAANWEPNRVPASGDEVVITNSGTYTVTLNANASPARLTLGGESGLQTLAISGSTLNLQTEGWVIGNGVLALSGGTLTGLGVLTVSNVMDWTGGTMSWGGATVIAPGATLNVSGSAEKLLNGHTVKNFGTVMWSGTGRIVMRSEWAGFRNEAGGVFEVQNDAEYVRATDMSAGSFQNAGTFRKTGGTGTTTFQAIPFHNTGTISVWSGTLNFSSSPTLGPATTFEIGLAGATQTGNYGRITCSQAVQLVGHLAVTFVGGFLPDAGEDYPVIVAPIRGAIESFSAPPISPEVFITPVYAPTAVRLVTISPVPVLGQPGTDAQGRFTMDIQGIASQRYGVEATADFVEWTPLVTNAIPASTVWRFMDEDSLTLPYRFYRVWFEPQPENP